MNIPHLPLASIAGGVSREESGCEIVLVCFFDTDPQVTR